MAGRHPANDVFFVQVNKGKRILIILLLLGLAAFLGYTFLPSREPSYQGKPVTVWLDGFAALKFSGDLAPQSLVDLHQQAQAALTAIGPQAAPYIVRKLKQSESSLYRKYRETFPRLPKRLAKILPRPKADFTAMDGGGAFLAIGPSVEPRLAALLADHSPAVREAAASALGWLSHYDKTDIRDAIPSLTQGLKDQDAMVRVYCAMALGKIGPDAHTAVAALTACLNDPEIGSVPTSHPYVRASAARALGQIGPQSKVALPALKNLMQDQDAYRRVVAAIAIWRIDSDVTNTLPVLIDGLNKVISNSTWEVVEGMGEMGPRAKEAVPALIENLQRESVIDAFNREKITDALKKIDPDAAAKAGVK